MVRKELNRQLEAIYGDQIEIEFKPKHSYNDDSDEEMCTLNDDFTVTKLKDVCENKLKIDKLEYEKY